MGFEVFNKRAAGVSKHPYVTIQRKGPFSFNQAAFELMGSPEAVELLYDKDTERVGFRPVAPDRPQAFPVRAQGKNSVTHIVAGQSFAGHYGLDVSVARRYPVAMEDDILVLDLRGDSVDVTGPRAKKTSADGSGESDE
jgi:hypothetical protein